MRLDKYLKVSRLIKRRGVAADACDAGRVFVNGKVAKPSFRLSIDDVIEIKFGEKPLSVRVLTLTETTKKEDSASLYEVIFGS